MKNAIFAFAALSALAAACTAGVVQFASENSIEARRYTATPGEVFATEGLDGGSNLVATLTVGTPDGTRARVIDRDALHKTPLRAIDYPDFYIELGESTWLVDERSVCMFEDFDVPGCGQSPPTVFYTRTFRIVPLGGLSIVDAAITAPVNRGDAGTGFFAGTATISWETRPDGSVIVSASIGQTMHDMTWNVVVSVGVLKGRGASQGEVVEDLTLSDFVFLDSRGRATLGTLRDWVGATYDPYKADRWAAYPANSTVNLAGQTVRLSRNAGIVTESTAATNDTVTLWHGYSVALRSVQGVSTNGTAFGIIGFEAGAESVTIYTETSVPSPPYAVATASLTSPDWMPPSGQSTSLATYKGEPAYAITVPKGSSSAMFYRAVSDGAATSAYLYTEQPLYAGGGVRIQSPNGNWWRLAVDNSGNLSATQEASPPEELR